MSTAVTIYGIKACDTMKKARNWLQEHGIDARFHDYKTEGLNAGTLGSWVAAVGWETLLNRAGTTFRKLGDAERADLTQERAIALMLAHTSLIKRPVLDIGGKLLVGFKPELYEKALG